LPQGGNYAALIALFYFFFFLLSSSKSFLGKNHSSIFKNSNSETIWEKIMNFLGFRSRAHFFDKK